MPRFWKAMLLGLALLVPCALALFIFLYPNAIGQNLTDWAKQLTGPSIEDGPRFVVEVDSNALRRHGHEMLRDAVRADLREGRISISRAPRVTDAGVEVWPRDTDRQAALARLAKLGQPGWFDISEGDGGVIRIAYTEARLAEQMRQAVELSISTIESRLADLGGFRFSVRRQGDTQILVQVSRSEDLKRLIELATKHAKLEFRMVDGTIAVAQALASRAPPESEILYGWQKEGKQPYLIEKRVIISGGDIADARPGFDLRTSEPVVNFRFNAAGARRFAQATTENVGRPFAIVLDNEVISAPVIREPITGGQGQISGNFTVQSANDLAILMRAGALPAPLKVIEERAAGP